MNTPATTPASQRTRYLHDFANADGRSPDGVANDVDDTVAMTAALEAGPGVVRIGAGHYRFGDVTIPQDVMVAGAGHGTIIHANEASTIFRQQDVNRWTLRDMVLDGEAQGDWQDRKDTGRNAVFVHSCIEWEMSGLVVRNVQGAGIQIAWVYSSAPFKNNGTIFNVHASDNYIGIRFDERAEYINASALGCWSNVVGCAIHGGNIKITNSNFNSNLTGLFIEDKDNGSHGSITNCLVNHNLKHSLHCSQVTNGMIVDACCFFDGDLLIENAIGVSVTSGIIACSIKITGKGVNRIAGNHIQDRSTFTFDFTPATILQDNFTSDGPWSKNTG